MRLPAIVLAGERPGGNPLAQSLGKPAGILVEVAGEPCVTRVLDALGKAGISDITLIGPEPTVAERAEMQAILTGHGARWLAPESGPAESATAALKHVPDRPVLITSADHALLTPEIVRAFMAAACSTDLDFVAGLVPYEQVRRAFPDSKRTLLRFSDGIWCGSNLYLVRTVAGIRAVEFWRRMQSHRKRPWRMAMEIGLPTLLAYLRHRLTLRGAIERISALAGCRIGYVEISEARAAVDVDSLADHALAEQILSAC